MVDTQSERQRTVDIARSWLGTPFHHAARIKGVGVDCVQLPLAVYAAVGVIVGAHVAPYSIDWFVHQDDERFLDAIGEYCAPVDVPAPGDIALFRYGRSVSHAAIVVAIAPELLVVHSYRGRGVTLEEAGPGTPLGVRLAGCWSPKRWAMAEA